MAKDSKPPARGDNGGKNEVSAFLEKVARTPVKKDTGTKGRLIFALDATASREPTWDTACQLQGEMFAETASLGGLSIQLCYYRGFNEFFSGNWCDDASALLTQMTRVRCLGGHTQIGRLLQHALNETGKERVQALVFVGDAIEENPDALCNLGGQLGLRGLPVFVFQEGNDPNVMSVFKQIAQLSGGAWAPFNAASAAQLKALLSAVAVFAAGGKKALEDFSKRSGKDVLLLTQQLN
jgi:hypothetical protein